MDLKIAASGIKKFNLLKTLYARGLLGDRGRSFGGRGAHSSVRIIESIKMN